MIEQQDTLRNWVTFCQDVLLSRTRILILRPIIMMMMIMIMIILLRIISMLQGTVQKNLPTGLDMSVNVLTTGYWPSEKLIPATLPKELATCSQVFSEFYLSKQSGRKLVWHNSLGTCIMKVQFKKGPKELSVSLFQVANNAWKFPTLALSSAPPPCSSSTSSTSQLSLKV